MAIDFAKNERVFDHERFPIQTWEVWFETPFGLCKTHSEAAALLRDRDMDAGIALAPVCVAIDVKGNYEAFRR